MDYKCKVLWVDDKPLEYFESVCNVAGISFEKRTRREDGINEMKLNADKYDCVILDVRMNEEETKEECIQGLKEIRDVSQQNNIPAFIFTGQPDFFSDAVFATYMGIPFTKGEPNSEEELCKKILEVYENKTETKLREQYKDVFASTNRLGINSVCDRIILPIIKNIHYPSDDFDPMVYYTSIRRLIEYIFRSLNKKRILPDEFIPDDKVNLNQSYHYLSGGFPEFIPWRYGKKGDTVFHQYMSNIIKSLLFLGDIQSHTVDLSDDENKIVQQVLTTANAKYFIEGALLQLCDVLTWTANNIDTIEDKRISMQEIIDKYVGTGTTFNPVHIKDNLWHIDDILIKSSKPLKNVEITGISWNKDEETNGDFIFFAKYKIV